MSSFVGIPDLDNPETNAALEKFQEQFQEHGKVTDAAPPARPAAPPEGEEEAPAAAAAETKGKDADKEPKPAKTEAKPPELTDEARQKAADAAEKAREFARRREQHRQEIQSRQQTEAAPASREARQAFAALRQDPSQQNLDAFERVMVDEGWEPEQVTQLLDRLFDQYASRKLGLEVDSKSQGQDSEAARLRKQLQAEREARRQAEEAAKQKEETFAQERATEAAKREIERVIRADAQKYRHLLAQDEIDPIEWVWQAISGAYANGEIGEGDDVATIVQKHALEAEQYQANKLRKQAEKLGFRLVDEQQSGSDAKNANVESKPRASRTISSEEASEKPDQTVPVELEGDDRKEATWKYLQEEARRRGEVE